jgi:hypothetical protein
MVDNYGTVTIRGAFSSGRARVLWHDGLLRAYGVNGLMLEVAAEKPTRKKGHLRAWDVKTERGDISLHMKCITCGGRAWWRTAFTPAEELWGST